MSKHPETLGRHSYIHNATEDKGRVRQYEDNEGRRNRWGMQQEKEQRDKASKTMKQQRQNDIKIEKASN